MYMLEHSLSSVDHLPANNWIVIPLLTDTGLMAANGFWFYDAFLFK